MYCMINGDNINNSYILVYRLCAFSVIIFLYSLIIIRHTEGHSFTPSPGLNFGTEKIKTDVQNTCVYASTPPYVFS